MPSASRTGPTIFALGGVFVGSIATGVIAYFAGNVNLQRNLNFTPNGVTSGAVLQINGLTRYQTLSATCTATGGLTGYSTCYLPSPLSTTGSLIEVSLECGNVAKQLTGDVSFKTTRLSSTGTALTNLNNIVAGTGSLERAVFTTEQAWNPAQALTYSTLVTPGSTAACRLYATLADHYGE